MDILNGHVKKSDRNNSVFDWNNAGVPTLTYITMAGISELYKSGQRISGLSDRLITGGLNKPYT